MRWSESEPAWSASADFWPPSLPPSLPWVAARRGASPTGLWGADNSPACFLGTQVQRFLENNRIKYLKSPTRLLWILCSGNLQHLSPRTLFRYSDRLSHLRFRGGNKLSLPHQSFGVNRWCHHSRCMLTPPPLKKAKAYLWLRKRRTRRLPRVGSPQQSWCARRLRGGGGAWLISF